MTLKADIAACAGVNDDNDYKDAVEEYPEQQQPPEKQSQKNNNNDNSSNTNGTTSTSTKPRKKKKGYRLDRESALIMENQIQMEMTKNELAYQFLACKLARSKNPARLKYKALKIVVSIILLYPILLLPFLLSLSLSLSCY